MTKDFSVSALSHYMTDLMEIANDQNTALEIKIGNVVWKVDPEEGLLTSLWKARKAFTSEFAIKNFKDEMAN